MVIMTDAKPWLFQERRKKMANNRYGSTSAYSQGARTGVHNDGPIDTTVKKKKKRKAKK